MATPTAKANVGSTLFILFLVTFVTGIILHLKKHGIVVEPRAAIKVIHWVAGFLMVAFTFWHGKQFWKMLTNMTKRFLWFKIDTWVVIVFVTATTLTGLVKLLSPVKIPHLGLWHYQLGLIMTAAAAIHLIRGIPSWNRLRKVAKKQ